jgi:hypothetical protein
MNTPDTRARLHDCLNALAECDVSDELRQLSIDLLGHLLSMHADQRLNGPVFLLALDTLELVPGLEDHVERLRATVHREVLD